MKRLPAVAAALLCAAAATPAAAAIDVNTFLAKVAALKAKGVSAIFSSDVGLLKRETAGALTQIAAEKKARAAAGKPPLYCTPPNTKMAANEMIAGLAALPAAERASSLKDGMVRVIAAKYPCR